MSQPPASGMTPDSVFSELQTIMESESDKDNPQYHYNLGLAFQRCNKTEEALDEFQKAFDGLESKVDCCIRMAECNMALNRFDEAQNLIKKGLGVASLSDEEKLELNYQSGLIYKAKGEIQKALKLFRQIHALDKNFKSVSMEIKKLSQQ